MTIDRILNAAAPRIEKSGAQFAQSSALEGLDGAILPGKSVFSSVLNAMTDGAPDTLEPAAANGLPVAIPAQAAVVPLPALDPAMDSVAVLAPTTDSFRPALAAPDMGLPGQSPPVLRGAQPEAAIVAASGPRPAGAGTPLPDPAKDGVTMIDADTQSGPVVQAPTRRHGSAGTQNASVVATPSDSAMGRAGDGQTATSEVTGGTRPDWRAATVPLAERAAFMSPAWSESAGGGFRALPALRGSDRASGRAVFLPLDAAAPGSVASSGFSAPLASGASVAATADAPMAPGASSDVAHKVHYWVTRGVQTAELQLDAPGGSAVDVSITLQGKEALVEFRSDQPEARRVIQEAMPQLRDMLRAEGLQLAGGFVGSSAQQKQGDAHPSGRDRASGRIGTVSVSAADAARPARIGGASTHALDVFV